MKTAVVILNFNGQKLMEQFLPGVIAHSPEAEIIVADNCSTDDSVVWLKAAYPELRVIEMSENYGFAEGYNQALSQVDAEYYVLLNSDVEIKSNWLQALINHMDNHPNCAACQPKILSQRKPDTFEYAGAAGGYIDKYGYPFCRGRIFSTIEDDNKQYDTTSEIFWATGACLVIRAELYHSIGGLDGDFFAHQEEIDLCWRIKSQGYSIVCIPESEVFHVGAATLDYESPRKTYLNFRNNALTLYKNIHGWEYIYIYIIRIFLDWMAAIQIALSGKRANAAAIIKAQKDFLTLKRKFKQKRFDNLKKTTNFAPKGKMNALLLWQYYFAKKMTYDRILEKVFGK